MRTFRPFALALVGLGLAAGSALASGGTPYYKHDNSGSDNWCTLFANGQDMNRWCIRYGAHELDPTAVICQGNAYIFNFQTKTDAQGAYRMADLPPASYLVRAATRSLHEPGAFHTPWQAFEPGSEAKLVQVPSGGEAEKSFRLEGGTGAIEGRVEDANGAPMAGVKVAVLATSTLTGPAGDFRLEGVPGSDHVSLAAFLDGYRVDGILFVDHLTALKRNMIMRKLIKTRRLRA